jgi:hypothetical protein
VTIARSPVRLPHRHAAIVIGVPFPCHHGVPLTYAADQPADWMLAGLQRNYRSCPATFRAAGNGTGGHWGRRLCRCSTPVTSAARSTNPPKVLVRLQSRRCETWTTRSSGGAHRRRGFAGCPVPFLPSRVLTGCSDERAPVSGHVK